MIVNTNDILDISFNELLESLTLLGAMPSKLESFSGLLMSNIMQPILENTSPLSVVTSQISAEDSISVLSLVPEQVNLKKKKTANGLGPYEIGTSFSNLILTQCNSRENF